MAGNDIVDDNIVIDNHVLGYIAPYINKKHLRDIVVSQFPKTEISNAKSFLWQKCDRMQVLGSIVHRDSADAGAEHAETDDIIKGVRSLSDSGKRPYFVISAADLHLLPKYEPGELLSNLSVECSRDCGNVIYPSYVTVSVLLIINTNILDPPFVMTNFFLNVPVTMGGGGC